MLMVIVILLATMETITFLHNEKMKRQIANIELRLLELEAGDKMPDRPRTFDECKIHGP
jgi:hypothetical protein